jgi:hypothetical protein
VLYELDQAAPSIIKLWQDITAIICMPSITSSTNQPPAGPSAGPPVTSAPRAPPTQPSGGSSITASHLQALVNLGPCLGTITSQLYYFFTCTGVNPLQAAPDDALLRLLGYIRTLYDINMLDADSPRVVEYLILNLSSRGSAIRQRLGCCSSLEMVVMALQELDWSVEKQTFIVQQQVLQADDAQQQQDGGAVGDERMQQRWQQQLCSTVYSRLASRFRQQGSMLPDAGDFDACLASLASQLLAASKQQSLSHLQELAGPGIVAALLSQHDAGRLLLTLATVESEAGAKKEGAQACITSSDWQHTHGLMLQASPTPCLHSATSCEPDVWCDAGPALSLAPRHYGNRTPAHVFTMPCEPLLQMLHQVRALS